MSAAPHTRRAVLLALMSSCWVVGRASNPVMIELHIASRGDELYFEPDRLTCPAHARVNLIFHHTGEILSDSHDWVLLKPGTEARFIADADRQAEDVVVPPGDESLVLAATPLCGKGKIVSTTFTAPTPGRYVFVCSIPGHAQTMRGVLTVTPTP